MLDKLSWKDVLINQLIKGGCVWQNRSAENGS